jgi:prepilin-type N-terminal cleavage/methylation domain-containing protein
MARCRAEKGDALPSRNGFTLVEALIVVVLIGLLSLIGFPKISAALARNELRSARTAMINMVATARAAAVQGNRLTWIKYEGNRAYVLARPRLSAGAGTADTLGLVRDLAAQYKVTVPGTDSIQFDPRGFGGGFGAVHTIVVSRGSYSSNIVVDGLGRVLK